MKFLVKAELQTTPERAWGFYFDPTFNLELRKVMNVESLDEHEFVETDAQIRMVYHVVARRVMPDWVRKALPDVKIAFTSYDTFDKKKLIMETRFVPDILPNKISGEGVWTVKPTRPGWVERRYEGDLRIHIPLLGGKMEEKLAAGLEGDFALSNQLMAKWVQKDQEALAAGQPLPTLGPASPIKAHFPNGYRG